MTARYAIYFAPSPDSALAIFGQNVLGRSATAPRTESATASFPDLTRWRALTGTAAHYGFHATLKAPFELKPEFKASELTDAVSTFAAQQTPVPLTQLAPRQLSYFAALTVDPQPSALSSLAQSIVEAFDTFRQPLSVSDRQRRLEQSLTSRQIDLLDQFGYPYVAEEFRFHMTLSNRLSAADNDYVSWLQDLFMDSVNQEPCLDRIAVYQQANRQSAFVEIASCPF